MTAIAGFHCADGVVLAADTEESYGNDKAYGHKLFPVERSDARLCVAGAGLGYLIDYANEQIVSALDSGITDVNAFYIKLADILDELYVHGGKFSRFPVSEPAELRIDLLIGVQFLKDADKSIWTRPALFECRSNLVTRILRRKQSCIVGSGEVLKQLGIQFAGWGLTTTLAELASINVIHQAKRRYGGVGGKTHIFTMRTDGTFTYNRGGKSVDREPTMERFERVAQMLMLCLDPSMPDARVKDLFSNAERWMKNERKHLQQIEREGKGKHESIDTGSRDFERLIKRMTTPSVSQKSEPEQ
ncbi:MAG TPA: hypothetical protein VGA01_04815 [Candidatus Binatia bacterium]